MTPDGGDIARTAARAADAKQGLDTVVLDVGHVLAICGWFVVTSAPNTRLVRTIASEIAEAVRREHGLSPLRTEGASEQQWVLLDYGDVVVHVFFDEARRFYDIERLYRDAPNVEWRAAG